MESWRERGFVPDSDDSDGFDSQDTRGVSQIEGGQGGVSVVIPVQTQESLGYSQDRIGESTDTRHGEISAAQPNRISDDDGDNEEKGGDYDEEEDQEDEMALIQEEGRELASRELLQPEHTDRMELANRCVENSVGQGDTSPAKEPGSDVLVSQSLSEAADANPPSTPQRKKRDIFDIPSSSPDALQLGHKPWRKSIPISPQPAPASHPRLGEDNMNSSPLSSPLSSIDSASLGVNDPQQEQPPNLTLEDLPPLLDIPEEILQELAQPVRRTLRQRNPIQLHPYLLEDAKYQNLMKARGVKPVRIAQYQEAVRAAAAAAAQDSQSQEFPDDPGSPSVSQSSNFPSSPIDPRKLFGLVPSVSLPRRVGQQPSRLPDSSPTNDITPRSAKRRRIIKASGEDRRSNQWLPSPQVVIHTSSFPGRPEENDSLFDIPSPPRSGSVSSQTSRRFPEFRFPPGFSPPVITPATESGKWPRSIVQSTTIDEPDTAIVQDESDTRSVSSESRFNSDLDGEEEEGENEAALRRFQRKIKGTLPASWVRLDQQKQRERLSSTQRISERASRAENARGVARIVAKKPRSVTPTVERGQLSSLRHLADEDSGEENSENDRTESAGAQPAISTLFGLDDSFINQEFGDILEDNRIDYMFPPARSNRSSSQKPKQAKKRPRPKTRNITSDGQSKRPRFQRQARLTDPVYGGRKKVQRPENLPRLGVLDAPDVATRPRHEQPQFLRIAARKARSRQDRGRKSPSRKIFMLSSRLETDDANASLREWRAGRLRQTDLPKYASAQPRRQPLMSLSTNQRKPRDDHRSGRPSKTNSSHIRPTAQPRENGTLSPPPTTSPSQGERPITGTAPVSSVLQIQPEQRGSKWVIRRNYAVSSLTRNTPRPAIPDFIGTNGAATSSTKFQRSLALLNKDFKQKLVPSAPFRNPLLGRFLDSGLALPNTSDDRYPKPTGTDVNHLKPPNHAPRRQSRKRPPKRVDPTIYDQRPTSVLVSGPESPVRRSGELVTADQETGGLVGFQTAYTIDFNISPLHPGTFFHESTFIGSGEFSRSLNIANRDLDKSVGSCFHIKIGGRNLRWGPWNDTIFSEFEGVFDKLIELAEKGSGSSIETIIQDTTDPDWTTYRDLVKYVSDILSFTDPVDRSEFVKRASVLVSKVVASLSSLISAGESNTGQLTKIASFTAVFANQLCQISCHSLVDRAHCDELVSLAKSATKHVIALVFDPAGQKDIGEFLAESKSRDWREAGIKEAHPAVEAYVVALHILHGSERFKGCFEDFTAEEYSLLDVENENQQRDISWLENGWRRVFIALPLQEIDALGIARTGSRFKGGHDNWIAVNQLLQPTLDFYDTSSTIRPVSSYQYCRTLFHRCFILINSWGWRDCRPILGTLYDFFAKRTLYDLEQEESYKSPSFLDKLDANPSFEVMPGDPCFHILLKIIGTGLRYLTVAYDKKKIRNFTWRLLPNHGRAYPKEQPVRQTDLDALRNHHDLLCTLYSSVPDGCRPRLDVIRNIVQPATSHREICNISLRAWTRLARFKLSTDEDISGLEPFADWHCYFVTELLKQHALARREVEAQNTGDKKFSQRLIERTIAQNQRQIESLLKTALHGLQSAVNSARTLEHARMIASMVPISSLLGLFNPRVCRLNSIISEALQVILVYIQKCRALAAEPARRAGNQLNAADEDSQEYGDWTAIEAVYGGETVSVPLGIEHVEKSFHPAVSRLVSNCFGEDICPEDGILQSVVKCWTALTQTLVKNGLRHWDSYLSPYDGDSWAALRWTPQTRKFTPQFLARCIDQDGDFLSECKMQILGMWMSSLVERVSCLKYQHRLTEALLNQDPTEPLLQNLPFSRDTAEGRYSITLEDFSSRRLSLISCLLSNMRANTQDLDDAASREASIVRQEYRELIQKMMSSMKENYQDLGCGSTNLQGQYVDFVHLIVGFLQQHTRDICPIDSFFTDPSSFPLPSTDPTYIVARLKSYEPKLSSERVAKTLITFTQGVSERAALDGQQTYLVNQLHSSMAETYESGDPDQPTLRATLLQCVFPAYLELAFDNPAAWLLSRPIMQTISLIFKDLLFNMDTTDSSCMQSVLNIFYATFQSSYQALQRPIQDFNLLKEPTVLVTATTFMEMITSAVPIVDYIDRATDMDESIMAQIQAFKQFALLAITRVSSESPASDVDDLTLAAFPISPQPTRDTPTAPLLVQEIRDSAVRELQAYINECWSRHQNKYYFIRRGAPQPQEIQVEASIAAKLEDSPEMSFLDATSTFLHTLSSLDLLDDHN